MGDWFTDAFPLNLNQEEKEKKQNVIDSIDVADCIDVARPKTEKNRRRGHWTDKNNSYRSRIIPAHHHSAIPCSRDERRSCIYHYLCMIED